MGASNPRGRPPHLSASDSSGVKVDWPAVTQFTDGTTITSPIEYHVFRSTTSGFTHDDTNQIAIVAGPTTQYHDVVSNNCATYYYLVTAKVCCGEGDPSPRPRSIVPRHPSARRTSREARGL